ncbi:MAG: CCA tRNA nucleotidyltransferase [Phycisphaeraceae bacterium]
MAQTPETPREAAIAIIQTLRDNGFTAYLAGGCVRDALLGLEPKDYDVATDAHPASVKKLFPRCQMVGEAFGVALVRTRHHATEVATFRQDEGYSDRRRPDAVTFTTAQRDAQRRDFTINGLFANPLDTDPKTQHDRIIDYVGGLDDLKAQRIRAIGDPDDRFDEDYLRMLRAVRFAARLDFQLEPRTAASIRPLARYLGQISRERIGTEVLAMLAHPRRARAVQLLEELRLDGPTLNEDHLAPTDTNLPLDSLPAYATPALALAAWWITRQRLPMNLTTIAQAISTRSSAHADRWRKALCLSNQVDNDLRGILRLITRAENWDNLRIAARKRLLAEPLWPQTRTLLHAINDQPRTAQIETDSDPLIAQGVAPEPLLRGEDLLTLGIPAGPDLGRMLDQAYDAQLEGVFHDKTSAQQWLKNQTS